MKSEKVVERFLQNQRFGRIKDFVKGDILDFGGNKGEVKEYLDKYGPPIINRYVYCNYDYSKIEGDFDITLMLAVLEHLPEKDMEKIFEFLVSKLKNNGRMIIITPTKIAKPVLEFLAFLRILDKENIKEHKKYWNFKDLKELADRYNLKIEKYYKFQLGFNQMIIFRKI